MFRREVEATSGSMSVWVTEDGSCDLLLIHSLGSSGETFEQLCEQLPDVTCWAPDLWGHGGTASRSEVSVDQMAGDLASLIAEGPPPVVLGVSFGGIVAQALASRHPDVVRALVLCNTVARWGGGEARFEQQAAALRAAPTIDDWRRERNVLVADASPRSVASYFHATEQCGPDEFMESAKTAYTTDTTPYWSSISCPAFVVTGEHESRIPEDATEYLVTISGARSVNVVPGADHLCHLDRPGATAMVVREVLNDCRRIWSATDTTAGD